MKITALIENTSSNEILESEHGLSLYIETEKHKLLFDMGASCSFYNNALKLGIDLSDVDIAILSHGHDDHSGGMATFLEINKKAPVYASQYAFELHMNAPGADIGVDKSLLDNGRIISVCDYLDLGDGLTLLSCNDKPLYYPIDHSGLKSEEDGIIVPDSFRHEQYLLIEENGKRVLISGCSHKGIMNIVKWFSPDILIGGFHYMRLDTDNPDDRAKLDASAALLSSFDTIYYTGHCTGAKQYSYLKALMGSRLNYISTGTVLAL